MRRIRRGALSAIGALMAAALFVESAAAAKLPEWARPVAESAEPAPPGVPDHPSRVLFSETRVVIRPDGQVRHTRRFAAQALGADTSDVGIGWFPFGDTSRVTGTRAWHLPPGDRAKKSWMAPADIAVGDVFLGGAKLRAMRVPGIRKGSLVFFEFEAIDRPWFLSLSHLFYEGAPARVVRYELETPPGWSVRWTWLRRPGPDPTASGEIRAWEMRDIPDFDEEPLGVRPEDEAALLVVGATPGTGAPRGLPVFATWSDFSSWYDGLLQGRHDATPEVRTAASKIEEAPGDGILGRVRSVGRFVRDSVRYVAVELGIGGFQPRPASETLANLYGDCKDKGTLFRSLLAESGVESYPVLVNLSSPETASPEVPSRGFNHFVVAVPLPTNAAIAPDMASATLEAGDLGRLLIVDTTDEWTSIGSLSAGLAGRPALLVAGARGRLVKLPAPGPAAHRIERRIRVSMAPDRSVAIESESVHAGEFAARARRDHGASAGDRRQRVERRMLHLWPDAVVADYSSERETLSGEFIEKVTGRIAPSGPRGPAVSLDLFPGAGDDVERVALGRRKGPVVYPHPMTVRYEVRFEGFPGEYAAPRPLRAGGEGWSVRADATRDAGGLTARWEVVLSRTRFEPDSFPGLREFWSAVTSSAGWSLGPGGGQGQAGDAPGRPSESYPSGPGPQALRFRTR